MNGSLRLGSVLGITIRVHFLLLVLLLWLVVQSNDAGFAALFTAAVFGIVLLHELGHSVVAMSFGLRVLDITLWPLGGIARMSDIPESSKVEGLIAIAGPIVNFVLAAIAALVAVGTDTQASDPSIVHALAIQLMWANLLMGGFNLIPAFPMDGGRVLRALLGRGGDWVKATERAVRVGRVFAFLLALAGLLMLPHSAQGIVFILIALFVWVTSAQELTAVRARHTPDPYAAFREFAQRASNFPHAPHGWTTSDPWSASAPPRPAEPDPREDGRGYSEGEIDRLERFRGPLRNWRDET